MDEIMAKVPYGDFIDGVMARADMNSIRALVKGGSVYCSDEIEAVLGLPVKKEGETK